MMITMIVMMMMMMMVVMMMMMVTMMIMMVTMMMMMVTMMMMLMTGMVMIKVPSHHQGAHRCSKAFAGQTQSYIERIYNTCYNTSASFSFMIKII